MFRTFQIIIGEFRRSLLKLLHIHDLVRFCKQGAVVAHIANYTLYNRFLRKVICYHSNMFTKTK